MSLLVVNLLNNAVAISEELRACRGCLETEKRLFQLNAVTSRAFEECANNNLSHLYPHPQYICAACLALVRKFVSFKKRCRRSMQIIQILAMTNKLNTQNMVTVDRAELKFNLRETETEVISCPPQEACDPLADLVSEVEVVCKREIKEETDPVESGKKINHRVLFEFESHNLVSLNTDSIKIELEETTGDDNEETGGESERQDMHSVANPDPLTMVEVTTEKPATTNTSSAKSKSKKRSYSSDSSDSDDLPDCLRGINSDIYKKDSRASFPIPTPAKCTDSPNRKPNSNKKTIDRNTASKKILNEVRQFENEAKIKKGKKQDANLKPGPIIKTVYKYVDEDEYEDWQKIIKLRRRRKMLQEQLRRKIANMNKMKNISNRQNKA